MYKSGRQPSHRKESGKASRACVPCPLKHARSPGVSRGGLRKSATVKGTPKICALFLGREMRNLWKIRKQKGQYLVNTTHTTTLTIVHLFVQFPRTRHHCFFGMPCQMGSFLSGKGVDVLHISFYLQFGSQSIAGDFTSHLLSDSAKGMGLQFGHPTNDALTSHRLQERCRITVGHLRSTKLFRDSYSPLPTQAVHRETLRIASQPGSFALPPYVTADGGNTGKALMSVAVSRGLVPQSSLASCLAVLQDRNHVFEVPALAVGDSDSRLDVIRRCPLAIYTTISAGRFSRPQNHRLG